VSSAIVTVTLAFSAGIAGIWLGHLLIKVPAHVHYLHPMAHEDLSLTAAQKRGLDTLETAFAARRQTLEGEMRKANAVPAAAIRRQDRLHV